MKVGFIICEFNPLHNGHLKLIESAKSLCDKIVCIMSGDLVQRGEVAIVDKYTRATWAIQAGCDMVVELPPEYTLASAQIFATGASKIISLFNGEKALFFGSECGNIEKLNEVASIMQTPQYQTALKAHIKTGINYAQASSLAIQECTSKDLSEILSHPNNTLAVEYLKSVDDSVNCYTMQRMGNYNDSLDTSNPSAKSLRELIMQSLSVSSYVPKYVEQDLYNIKNIKENLFSLIKYQLPKTQNIDQIYGINEGLHNRILSSLNESESFDEFIAKVKTKRYTYTTICRIILNCLIENYSKFDELIDKPIGYINILAINKESKSLLSNIEATVITKPSDIKKNNLNLDLINASKRLFTSLNYSYDSFIRIL